MSYYRIDADSTLYLHYPGPVRRAYSTAVRERSALGRGKQLLTFAEQAVGWCASIAVSKYRNATSVNGVNRTVESSLAQLRERRGPAFGDYARLWREANAALIDTPECKHSWFSMDVAAAPGMSALARFANFLKEAEDSGPQTGQAVHDAATAIATATSTSGQVPLGEFVAALVWVRNKLEHPRISKSEDWESATPLLEAAVVELLCRTSVADVVQSHPVV